MKGVSGVLVFILIIVAIVGYLFYSGMIQFPGGGDGGTGHIDYDNNIISLENKIISVLNPISGTDTSLEFLVKNNGDKTVNNVEVYFGNLPGFSNINLDCENAKVSGNPCTFDIESLDARRISATLTASDVNSSIPVDISYAINYHYNGIRSATVPVIGKDVKDLPSGVSFNQPVGTVGPVQATIQPPVGANKEVNGQPVTEYFAKEGRAFTLQFTIQNVNSNKLTLSAGQNILTIISPNGDSVYADATINSCVKLIVDSSGNRAYLAADEPLPLTVQCTITAPYQNIVLYDLINLRVTYEYNYSLQFTDSFTILP